MKMYEEIYLMFKIKNWIPNAILAVREGGIITAKELQYRFQRDTDTEIDMHTVKISKYDIGGTELPRGDQPLIILDYKENMSAEWIQVRQTGKKYPRVLVVDDVLETGDTMKLALTQAKVIGDDVRFCVLAAKKEKLRDIKFDGIKEYTIGKLFSANEWVKFWWENGK